MSNSHTTSDGTKVESHSNGGIIDSFLPGGHDYTATAEDTDGNKTQAGGNTREEAEANAVNKLP